MEADSLSGINTTILYRMGQNMTFELFPEECSFTIFLHHRRCHINRESIMRYNCMILKIAINPCKDSY